MSAPDSLAAAEAEAAAARDRLSTTLTTLQGRLDPKLLAAEAVDGITEGGGKALRSGAAAARRNPGKAAGVAALAALFVCRRRIAALWRRRGAPDAQPPANEGVRPTNTRR